MTASLPAGSLRIRLRAATHEIHSRLDGALGLLDEDLSLARYRAVLARLHGIWRGWEPLAAGLLGTEVFGPERRRLALLDADLLALGLPAADIAALPVPPAPALRTAAEALGAMYVVEGSTLGGTVIHRHVARTLRLAPGAGDSYFRGNGARTGVMWRNVLALLDEVRPGDDAAVEAGAVHAFGWVAEWLLGASGSPEGGASVPLPMQAEPGWTRPTRVSQRS